MGTAGNNGSDDIGYEASVARMKNGNIYSISQGVSIRGAFGNQATPVTQSVVATGGDIIYKRAVGQ